MKLRHILCWLGRHDYHYRGVHLGQSIERCKHCGSVREGAIDDAQGPPAPPTPADAATRR